MPKNHKKGLGADLIGSPDQLVKSMVKDVKDQQWVINELVQEGPPHKQLLSAQLLQRLHKLQRVIESNTGKAFQLQKGYTIESATHEEEDVTMPFAFPLVTAAKADKEKIVEIIAHAPLHELLAYTMALQVIEWGIKNLSAGADN